MTIKTRILEKGINATMVLFVFASVSIYSCVAEAQTIPSNQMYTAGKKIALVEGVNTTLRATPLNSTINGAYEELKPSLTPCGNRLYFSRISHPNNTFGKHDNEDIWYSNYDPESQNWSEPIRLSDHLNNAGPNYINNVSKSGDTLVLGNQYLSKGKMRAGLSYSVNVRGKWSYPKALVVKNDYNMSQHDNSFVCLTSGVIIKSVQRTESYGERDLYVSFWDGEIATEPINMGGVINTEMDESSPFLASDNKTLYFASKGHNGFGGSDIWVTERLDDSWTNWSEPKNLGPAVNSGKDEEFFSITHCGNYAIFSKQVSVHNIDLYRISMKELLMQEEIENLPKSSPENSALASL